MSTFPPANVHNSPVLRLVLAVCCALTIATATAAPPIESLVGAFKANDEVMMKRVALSTSAHSLASLLESGDRVRILTAALVAPHVDDAPLLLAVLGRVAHSPDRSIALAASRSGLAVVRATPRERVAALEIDRGLLAEALRTWHALARDDDRFADIRVAALEVSSELAELLSGDATPALIELADDRDPELRAAAFELLPARVPAAQHGRLAGAIASDGVPAVAVAAAASLCGGLAFGDDIDVSIIDEALRAAIRALIAMPDLPAHQRIDAARCLRAVGERDFVAALVATVPAEFAAEARALANEAK